MKELFSITKFYFKLSYSFKYFKYKFKTSKSVRITSIVLLFVIIVYLPALTMIGKFYQFFYDSLNSVMQASYFIALGYFGVTAIIIFFGMILIFGSFYFSKDIENMLPLPIKPRNLILAKFLVLCTFEYLISAVIFLPIMIVYGVNIGGGFTYYLFGILVYLLLPIIPLGLAGIVIMIIMRFTNIGRHKDLLRGIALFGMLFLALYLNVIVMNAATSVEVGGEMNFIENMISNNTFFIENIGKYYPPVTFSAFSIVKTGSEQLLNFAYYVLTSIGVLALFTITSQKLYIGGLIGGKEVTSKQKLLTEEQFIKETKVSSKGVSLLIEDFKVMLRTPTYLFNCLSIVVIIPIMLIMMNVFSGLGDTDMQALLNVLDTNVDYFILILMGLIIFFSGVSPIASTTFSREGEANWLLRVAPLSSKENIFGRLGVPRLANIVFILLTNISFTFLIGFRVEVWLYTFIGGIVLSEAAFYAALFLDLNKPMFHWKTQTQAVKQNLNVVLSMLITLAYIAGLGGIGYLLLNAGVIMYLTIIILIVISMIVREILRRFIENSFENKLVEMD